MAQMLYNPPSSGCNDDLEDLYDVVQHPGNSRPRFSRSVLPRLSPRSSLVSYELENSFGRRVSRRLVPIALCILSAVLFVSIDIPVTKLKGVRSLTSNVTKSEARQSHVIVPKAQTNYNIPTSDSNNTDERPTENTQRTVEETGLLVNREDLQVVPSDMNVVRQVADESRSTQALATSTGSPAIYTFHIRRQDTIRVEDQAFMNVWVDEWTAAGYSARVLFVEDAMRHPQFSNFSNALDNLFAKSKRKRDPELKYCYFQYLAMAAVGGGMMVDVDTRPTVNATREAPPSNFTLYCATGSENLQGNQAWLLQLESQSGTPCAASGSADAWMRVAQQQLWAFEQNDDKRKWTDIQGLIYLKQYGKVRVAKERKATSWKPRPHDKCSFRTV